MKVSIVIPYHDIPETPFFISRIMQSIKLQTFKDYEIVLLKKGRMGETYNEAIRQSKGELIKLMGMDDFFAHKDALQEIVAAFAEDTYWVASACLHDFEGVPQALHIPKWNDRLFEGYNTVGGFATITIRNKDIPLINEDLDWCVDVDWYWRIKKKHGLPLVLEKPSVIVGVGPHQTTNMLTEEQKEREHKYTREIYGK